MGSLTLPFRIDRSAKNVAAVAIFFTILVAAAGGFSAACLSAGEPAAFRYGFDERVRQTYIENGFDLHDGNSDDWSFFRVRTRLWCEWKPAERWTVHAALNNEHRHWFKSTKGYQDEDFEINELIFEKLYISANDIAGSPLSMTVGRQNIMYGEGFLFMDGGPLDGSRTGYFNAVRLGAKFEKRSIELHMLSNPSWDKYLPTLNCQRQPLIDYDEMGAGAYYTDQSFEGHKIEGYYFYKNESEGGNTPESDIHTAGGRLSGKKGDSFSYATEWALQLGDRGKSDRKGFGGYLHGTFNLPSTVEPELTVGVIYLSGDDPSTDEYEGWDPLYSRWPKWSELLIYTMATTGNGIAYWDNLFAPNLKTTAKPMKNMTAEASIYFMKAVADPPAASWAVPGMGSILGSGKTKGFLSSVKIKYRFCKNLSGHLLWERFDPGDYYNEDASIANFLRWELFYTF
ncbi:MAG: alginate export family protein [Candidatus Krumholzibacteriota bacterium]|nr:alginate export family protein [Candidatus Krumholzibacteriota bacterium]